MTYIQYITQFSRKKTMYTNYTTTISINYTTSYSINTLFIIRSTYVTFAESLNGVGLIIAVDYDRYFVRKVCSEGTNARKYVPLECYNRRKDRIYRHIADYQKVIIRFVMAVRPSVCQHETSSFRRIVSFIR